MLLGLSFLHNKRLLHRDLKPENVMMAGGTLMNGIVKIGDFGLSKFTTSTTNFAMTKTGTQTHTAPELY